MSNNLPQSRVALVYLARGKDSGALASFERFMKAYSSLLPGCDHELYILYKGFDTLQGVEAARRCFSTVKNVEIFTDDLSFDIGAYKTSLQSISEEFVCFLNTHSEPVSPSWLLKLLSNVCRVGVGLVGATASYESHIGLSPAFDAFPNAHIRTNAMMLRSDMARDIFSSFKIENKLDAYAAESGNNSITRQIMKRSLSTLLVGGDGRGYSPQYWKISETFRQGSQANLLVHDNETRRFDALAWGEKRRIHVDAWGTC